MAAGQLFNRVRVGVTGAPGTGPITIGVAAQGLTPAAAGVPDGYVGSACLDDSGGAWEIGVGTYNASANTWTRTTVVASSNGNAAINATSAAILSFVPLRRDMRTLLRQFDITSATASVGDTAVFTDEFSDYEAVFENILPDTNNVNVTMQFYSGGAWQTAAQYISGILIPSTYALTGGLTAMSLLYGNRLNAFASYANGGLSGSMRLFNLRQATRFKKVTMHGGYENQSMGPGEEVFTMSGSWKVAAAVDGVRFQPSSGNFAEGRVKIYGVP